MESVQELVLPNVPDLMEPSEPVDGTDVTPMVVVELAPTARPAISVVEMEHAGVSPTVTTSTVVMMVVVDPVEPVMVEQSAKELLIPSPINATSTVTLRSESKSENSRPTSWLEKLALLQSLDPTALRLPAMSTQDPTPVTSLWMSPPESMEITNFQPTVLDIFLTLRLMPSMFLDNLLPFWLIGTQFKLRSEMRIPNNCFQLPPFKLFLDLTL
jgi:hypothetical protein